MVSDSHCDVQKECVCQCVCVCVMLEYIQTFTDLLILIQFWTPAWVLSSTESVHTQLSFEETDALFSQFQSTDKLLIQYLPSRSWQ